MAKRILRELRLDKIAAVDKPCQEGATMAIIKRDAPTKSEDGKHFPASDYAYVPDPNEPSKWKLRLTSTPGGEPDAGIVGAAAAALGPGYRGRKADIPEADRAAVVASVRAAWRKANPGKKADEMPEGIRKAIDAGAIAKTLYGIAGGTLQTGAQSFSQTMTANQAQRRQWDVNEALWPLFDALGDSVRSIVADAALNETAKINAIRQSVDQFTAAVVAAVPDAEAEIDKVFAEPALSGLFHAGSSGSTTATKGDHSMADTKTVEELQKSLDEVTALLAKAESLTPKEMEFMNGLSAAEKKKFMAAESSERSTMMTKAADSDPVVYKAADGTEFRKSHDPMLVNLAKRADEAEKLAKAEREAREMGEFTKRASDEFAHLPGELIAKANVLKAVAAMGEAERNALDVMLKAGEKALAKGFERFGTGAGGVDASSPEAKLEAMTKARVEKANVSKEVAYSEVLQSPEGQALYSEMRALRMSAE